MKFVIIVLLAVPVIGAMLRSNLQGRLSTPNPLINDPVVPDHYGNSVFHNASEYASWTQYLCRTLFKANAPGFLSLILPRLRALVPQLNAGEAMTTGTTLGILSSFIEQSSPDPIFLNDSNHHAERLLLLLAQGHYAQVRFEVENLLKQVDYHQLTPKLKKLSVVVALMQYDLSVPDAPLPLWSTFWGLNDDQMLAATLRAGQLTLTSSQGNQQPSLLPPSHPNDYSPAFDIRPLLNIGLATVHPVLLGHGLDIIESALVTAARDMKQSNSCSSIRLLDQAIHAAPSMAARLELSNYRRRLGDICVRRQLEATFRTFCQVGADSPFPISEAISYYDRGTAIIAKRAEKAFWIRLAAGDCQNSRLDLQTLESSIHPSTLQKRSYLTRRLRYMKRRHGECQPITGLYLQHFGAALMEHLINGNVAAAEEIWQLHFLQAHDDRLAMAWKQAIIVATYPKVIFNPCTGNSLLTGIALLDKRLFARLDHIAKAKPPSQCWNINPTGRDLCNFLWLKAFYISGNLHKVEEYTKLVTFNKKMKKEAQQIKACTALCGSESNHLQACQASDLYHQLPSEDQSSAHFRIGSDLASRLCRLVGKPEPDWFYLRDGPSPIQMSKVIEKYISIQSYHPRQDTTIYKALKDRFALAVAKSVICPCRRAEFMQGFSIKKLGCTELPDFLEKLNGDASQIGKSRKGGELHHLNIKVERLAKLGYLQEAADYFHTEDRCSCINDSIMREYGVN